MTEPHIRRSQTDNINSMNKQTNTNITIKSLQTVRFVRVEFI